MIIKAARQVHTTQSENMMQVAQAGQPELAKQIVHIPQTVKSLQQVQTLQMEHADTSDGANPSNGTGSTDGSSTIFADVA